jgi:hypothetical protein
MKITPNLSRIWMECKAGAFILLLVSFIIYTLAGCSPITTVSSQLPPTSFQNIIPTQTKSDEIQNISGDLRLLIAEAEKTMPRAKTEGFIIPTKSEQLAFENMVLAIEGDDPESAGQSAITHYYQLIKFSDQENFGAESYILREQLPIKKGWGVYVFNIKYPRNIIIEAPHPLSDEETPEVALNIFRALNARALLISGTHRDANRDGSADSAHAPESIFHTVHVALSQHTQQFNQGAVFLQIHGFNSRNHPDYPSVVIGHNGKLTPENNRLLQNIKEALQDNNIQVGICDGKKYRDLCGTKNLQNSETQRGTFIHIELNESLRQNGSKLVESLRQAISQQMTR